MESKDTQGNQLFRESKPSHYTDYTTANGNVLKSAEYDCSVKPVINEELHEIIRRIYDEKLTEEMMAPKLRYDLIRLLLPNVKKEIIANAKKNKSNLKETNLQYHLIQLVPALFIASLHYRENERVSYPTTEMMAPPHLRRDREMCDYRFQAMILESLAKIDRLEYQIEDLEEGKGYMLEAEHRRVMKELKQQHRDELEEETYRATKKSSNESFEFEKENYQLKMEIQILKNKVEGLEKVIEINSNDNVSITNSETEDGNELEKEEVNLD